MEKKQYISGMYPEELEKIVLACGQPAYRTKQILSWLFKKNVLSLSLMSNLPESFRKELEKHVQTVSLTQEKKNTSKRDNTSKYAFSTNDNQIIESVYIPTAKRATICISTQAGCAFGCVFCASGRRGLKRNLTSEEIISQVLLVKKDNSGIPLTNIVFMGMGEPFANYDNVVKALRILNHPSCLGLAARKMTVSTCGLPKEIMRFGKEGLQVELSISLHAASDDLRSELMPVNKKYPLKVLIYTAKEYTDITHRIITFEYVIIKNINDKKEDARKLANLLKGMNTKVNLILFNPVEDSGRKFDTIKPQKLEDFKKVLEKEKIKFTVRRSRGIDIQGACGQLAGNFK